MQLDEELPEQDFDRLETHLRFCPECSAWADQVRDVTLRLRDSSVEVPAGGYALPRHTRRWRVSSAVALASAAAVVAAMFVAPGRHLWLYSNHHGSSVSNSASADLQPVAVSRLLRLEDGRLMPLSAESVSFRHV